MVDTILVERVTALEEIIKHKDDVISALKTTVRELQDFITHPPREGLLKQEKKDELLCASFPG